MSKQIELRKMRDHIVEIAGTTGGIVAALFIKIPMTVDNADMHRLSLAVICGGLSAVVSWFIKLFLNKMHERYQDKKRKDEWEKDND